jgi:hypothetical protein
MEEKCNNRGLIFKLISTYNNGNIYGICLLIIFPLYQYLENSRWKKLIVVLSLILSFSRTVWAGLIFSQFLVSIFIRKRNIFSLTTALAISILTILSVTYYFGFDFNFLFDRSLGGRIGQLDILESALWFPDQPFHPICEIVYLGILSNFGILGLVGYMIAMTSPIILTIFFRTLSPLRNSILCGLINFLFLSTSDGALLYVPVLVFYWFLSSLVLRKNLEPPSQTF